MATNGSKNGRTRTSDKVRVAIVGVGNCASSLVQGVHYYQDADPTDGRPRPDARRPRRLPHPRHRVRRRLRRRRGQGRQGPLRRPSSRGQNNTDQVRDVPNLGVTVQRGMTHDGLGKYLSKVIKKAPGADRRHRPGPQGHEAPTSSSRYLPVGSETATKWYVEQALQAGVALRQLHPGLHRARGLLEQALREGRPADRRRRHQVAGRRDDRPPPCSRASSDERGVQLERTYQLNVGGNTDFLNMLERERLESKKISKTNAVTSQLDYEMRRRQRAHRPVRPRRRG